MFFDGLQWSRKALLLAVSLVIMIGVVQADEQVGKLIDQGAYSDALKRIDDLNNQDGSDLASLTLLKGAVLVRMGRLDEGMTLFKLLSENYPNDAAIHNNIGVIHAERGELDKAKEAFEKAIKIKPEYHQAVRNLGDVHAEMACRTYGRIPAGSSIKIPAFCEVVEPKPIVPVKPMTAKTDADELTESLMNEVLDTLGQWRTAWEAQDVKRYLGFYSVRFVPKKSALTQWRVQRERSLKRPEWIKIQFDTPVFSLSNAQISVRFKQHYSASNYQDVVTKELVFIREGTGWKIISERII